jgi:hypothetical protein
LNANKSTEVESTDLEPRNVRALTEYLTVLEDVGRTADGLYLVVSQSGAEYLVDARTGACECPDHEYRGIHSKHARRVAFATGERPVPADVNGVDEQLGEHTDSTPQVVASDGGIIEAGDEGEVLDEGDGDGRPEDCDCSPLFDELPCWPCYRDGFEEPNPDEPATDE